MSTPPPKYHVEPTPLANWCAFESLSQRELEGVRHLMILDASQGCREFIFGAIHLEAGQAMPLHAHDHAETIFLLKGKAKARLDGGAVELEESGGAYFSGGRPHAIEALDGPATFLFTYPSERLGQPVVSRLVDEAENEGAENPTKIEAENMARRWAVAEGVEPFFGIEPTKGMRLRARLLFGPTHGQDEVIVGTAEIDSNVHYTLHYHAPAEIYFVRSGSGTIYVNGVPHEVTAGSTVYVPSAGVHGIDTYGSETLRLVWMYGIEVSGPNWVWTAVEDVYNRPRSAKQKL